MKTTFSSVCFSVGSKELCISRICTSLSNRREKIEKGYFEEIRLIRMMEGREDSLDKHREG